MTIDEILPKQLPCDVHEDMDGCPVITLKAEIKKLIDSCIPEKRPKTIETYKDFYYNNPKHRYVHGVDVGYNQAITEVRARADRLLNG